jgi:hypothetical protein
MAFPSDLSWRSFVLMGRAVTAIWGKDGKAEHVDGFSDTFSIFVQELDCSRIDSAVTGGPASRFNLDWRSE